MTGKTNHSPNGFLCTTAVWGESYTHTFLNYTLPSILSDGNLPSLQTSSIYQIYTTEKDADFISKNIAFSKLKEIMPVEFHFVYDFEHSSPYVTMTQCNRRAIYEADVNNFALIFISPDIVLANGTLANAESIILSGKRVVSLTGIRLGLERVAPILRKNFTNSSGILSIKSKEFVKLALKNLHPMCLKQIWNDQRYGSIIPYNLFWRVGTEGLLGRCFCLHPLMVYPKNKHAPFHVTIDQDYLLAACPDFNEHHIVTDSDEMLLFELTSLAQSTDGIWNCSINDLIQYSKNTVNGIHHKNAQFNIRLNCGIKDTELWANTILESDAIMNPIFQEVGIT